MATARWFEIPVQNIDRAKSFYETLLGIEIVPIDMTAEMGSMLGMFPDEDGVGGALVQNSQHGYIPSPEGTLIYLSAQGNLDETLSRVESTGGQVLLPKTSIGENGVIAWIRDPEGNKVGLHSMS